MKGQISNSEFQAQYPNAILRNNGTAITRYGQNTINYWMQHLDGSWTNYDCKTVC